MLRNHCRRNLATVLAIAAVALALPAQAIDGVSKVDALKMEVKSAKERGPKDKITTTCSEGSADYDIDQCYEDIKD